MELLDQVREVIRKKHYSIQKEAKGRKQRVKEAKKEAKGQTFKIHFKRKCPQRQIAKCLISELISSDCLFHSSKFLD